MIRESIQTRARSSNIPLLGSLARAVMIVNKHRAIELERSRWIWRVDMIEPGNNFVSLARRQATRREQRRIRRMKR